VGYNKAMLFQNTTIVTQEVNDAILSYKYNSGRILNLIICALFLGLGVGLTFIPNSYCLIIGIAIAVASFVMSFSFTALWKKTLKTIVDSERKKRPLKKEFTMEYVFAEQEIVLTLKAPGKSPSTEKHDYSFFNRIDTTEKYIFLSYGNRKKNPPLPIQKNGDAAALETFLASKIGKIHHHKN
jgi:uncharacterized membrane protein